MGVQVPPLAFDHAWLSGRRIVEEDTSRGADIYRWRFGPRSTTRRNIDYYVTVRGKEIEVIDHGPGGGALEVRAPSGWTIARRRG
ncbi:MAG: hypothetical protein HY721_33515 [Planctomycetes bacterium]|nr:hypothetical protein [Planctomycetota bacterium]